MAGIHRVLIVGGGIGGMSAAILLSRLGIETELIDLDPSWRVYGAGITITGPTLRAFKGLGLLDAIKAQAYTGEGIQICNSAGERIQRLPTAMVADTGIPGSGGIMRPVLHKILADQVKAQQVRVRLGLSIKSLREEDEGADVVFTDESAGRFDLVIGADGLFSAVRRLIRPDAPVPEYTGQSAWRLVIPRPAEIDCRHFFLGGPYKVGLSPVSRDEMYMFLLENCPRRQPLSEALLAETLQELLSSYGGMLSAIRSSLHAKSPIVLRPLEAFFLPKPWHSTRALLIGDAAHPTTPQLASGAGMAVEDALVLAEEISNHRSVEELLNAFMVRRYERCCLVVQNSLAIGRLEQSGAPIASQTKLVEDSLRALATPI
jgi:2-polyprenyl-6-methoxyphenol hydroxylase-like FAD-dependent oxidoreductase